MDLLESILAEVPKDADGFDDLEAFWRVTERIVTNVFRGVRFNTGIPMGGDDSDSDGAFDYETSSDISVELPDSDDSQDEEETVRDHSLSANMSALSTSVTLSQVDISIALSPASAAKAVPKTPDVDLDESLASVASNASSGLNMSFGSIKSKVSGRGNKSSLMSSPSDSDASTVRNEDVHAAHDATLDTSIGGMTPSLQRSTISMNSTPGVAIPTPVLASSAKKRPSDASRRVSFGGAISPISSHDEEPVELGTPADDVYWNEHDQEQEPEGEEEELEEQPSRSPNTPASAAASSASKTPKSYTDSRLSNSYANSYQETPKGKVRLTPGSARSAISTPGSNEFVRGRRVSDSSFHMGSGDEGTSEEEEETSPLQKTAKGKGRGKGKRHLEDDEDEGEGVTDRSESFINDSYLHTISSANKKYAGKKIIEETKALAKAGKAAEAVKKRKRAAMVSEDEQHAQDDEDEQETDEEAEHGARRSRRATKGRRFAFWKNERPIYQEGTMVGLTPAAVTPKKVKKPTQRPEPAKVKSSKAGKKPRALVMLQDSEEDEYDHDFSAPAAAPLKADLPPVRLPKGVQFIDPVKKDGFLRVRDCHKKKKVSKAMYVVNVRSTMPPLRPLPVDEDRPAGSNKGGYAGHAFVVPEMEKRQMSGWIAGASHCTSPLAITNALTPASGYLDMPPQAIKDAEGVGEYAQVFYVASYQEGSLEFDLAHPDEDCWNERNAQRTLLSQGDSFFVPAKNIYRLENHSVAVPAQLFFVVIERIGNRAVSPGSSMSEGTVA